MFTITNSACELVQGIVLLLKRYQHGDFAAFLIIAESTVARTENVKCLFTVVNTLSYTYLVHRHAT